MEGRMRTTHSIQRCLTKARESRAEAKWRSGHACACTTNQTDQHIFQAHDQHVAGRKTWSHWGPLDQEHRRESHERSQSRRRAREGFEWTTGWNSKVRSCSAKWTCQRLTCYGKQSWRKVTWSTSGNAVGLGGPQRLVSLQHLEDGNLFFFFGCCWCCYFICFCVSTFLKFRLYSNWRTLYIHEAALCTVHCTFFFSVAAGSSPHLLHRTSPPGTQMHKTAVLTKLK